MSRQTALIALALVAAFPLISSAGTVTLTGTCAGAVSSHATIWFSLVNTGDQDAQDIVIQPQLHGFFTNSSYHAVGTLAPDNPVNYTMPVFGNVLYGSYPESFTVTYNQGGSPFSAVFPCIIAVGHQSSGLVSITEIRNQGSMLNATIQNTGALPENLTVYGMAPPSFNITKEVSTVINGYQEKNVSFAITEPNGTGSYTIAVALSYRSGNLNYAALDTYSYTVGSSQSTNNQQNLPALDPAETFIAAVITFILVLLAISIFKKGYPRGAKRRKMADWNEKHEGG